MNSDSLRRLSFLAALLLLLAAAALPARSQITLRWAPHDTTIAPGGNLQLSVWIDDAVDLRTFEAWVSYDTTIVRSISGAKGQLFVGLPCYIWEGFEPSGPGQWHGYAVAIGSTCWAVGPGELYRWNIEALANGVCPVTTVDVRLFRPDATLFPDVTLQDTTVRVWDGISSTPDPGHGGARLQVWPNPFNPRTTLSFEVDEPGPARIDVYDARGRSLGSVWEGWAGPGLAAIGWNGRAADGRPLPGGLYLFRLQGTGGAAVQARGVLVR